MSQTGMQGCKENLIHHAEATLLNPVQTSLYESRVLVLKSLGQMDG